MRTRRGWCYKGSRVLGLDHEDSDPCCERRILSTKHM
jgi:hypothetical protein